MIFRLNDSYFIFTKSSMYKGSELSWTPLTDWVRSVGQDWPSHQWPSLALEY